MNYKKTTTLSIAAMLFLGTFATAQTNLIEHETNSIIAYFDADGALLPTRQNSEYYRYFNSIVSGCYLIQDFYSQNDQKQTDPICFTDPSELQSWFPTSMQGPLVFWDRKGNKIQEGYSQQDSGQSGNWREFDAAGRANDYELINGEVIISYFDVDGNRQPNATDGGTFRTLIDYNADQDVYIVSDYYTDTRTKQMDPVVVQRDDLLRWDIKYRDGLYAYYDMNGDLATTEQYMDGRLDGVITHWYPDIYPAQKLEEFNVVNGKQEGLYVRWYSNGFPKIRMITNQGDITTIQCWNEQFNPLGSAICPTLFQDESEKSEEVGATIEEKEKPIVIIIPDEKTDTKDDTSTIQEGKINSSTVIFPHDVDGNLDKSKVIMDDDNSTPITPFSQP